jgi:hypothetical protein
VGDVERVVIAVFDAPATLFEAQPLDLT